jgi:hypothetical protein
MLHSRNAEYAARLRRLHFLSRFKRQLPKYATRFIEMCVMLCADHGPAVSGTAHVPICMMMSTRCSWQCQQCLQGSEFHSQLLHKLIHK